MLLLTSLPASARRVSLTILHTTDVHGRILPTRDYDGTDGLGGLLRCATVIEGIRTNTPNLLLVDAGDLYQGGMESFLTGGRIMNDALAWLQYDAWVVGNHEFDWGLDVLAPALASSSAPVLGANVGVRPGRPHPLPHIRPFVMRELDGLRVAIIGLTTPAIAAWSRPHLIGDVVFDGSVNCLQRVMPSVRAENPDLMVLLVHQGYRAQGDNEVNEVNQIARAFPEIDLILGGHTHQAVEQAIVNGVHYAQAGYYGIWLGRVELTYDTVARRLVERTSSLIPIRADVPMHDGLAAALERDLARAKKEAERLLGRTEVPLRPKSAVPGQSPIQQLIGQALAGAARADVVVHGALADEVLAEGPILERDLWRIVPYENSVGVLLLTAQQLKSVLEENARLTTSSQFMGVWGIRYDLHPTAPVGERVRNLTMADGIPPHPRQRLRVAFNSYVLASGGGRYPQVRRLADDPMNRLELIGIDTRGAVRNYIKKNSPLRIEPDDVVRMVR
jgi:2',3'-cyclic-nucleotide 2'-phosphodiesterase (5'-nucleotidase family)